MPNLPVILIAAILGYCGVIYEFVLAQSLSILFGQSIIQYSVTIGLFLCGMGVGAHFIGDTHQARRRFSQVQLVLCLIVPSGLFGLWWLAVQGWSSTARGSAYLLCLSIGALTGAELPLLLQFRSRIRISTALAADYLGMVLACLVFPLWLLPVHGIFLSALVTTVLNGVVLVLLSERRSLSTWLIPGLLIVSCFFEPGLREWLSQKLIAG